MPTLMVRRSSDYFGKYRRLKVLVDGTEVAALRGSASASIVLDSGRHEVQGKMDWTRSAPLVIEVSESAPLLVTFSMPFWDAFIESFARPGQAIKIKVDWAPRQACE